MIRTRVVQGTIGVLCLLAAAGCAGEGNESGIIHVQDVPVLRHSIEVRVGDVDDPTVGFSRISRVAVSESGTVYVVEFAAREIRAYDSEGQWLRTMGREGQGPGEFSMPTDFGLIGDTVWVTDVPSFRMSWFGPHGELLFDTPGSRSRIATDVPGLEVFVYPAKPRSDGLIESDFMIPGGQNNDYTVPVLLFDRDGAVVDTIGQRRMIAPRTVTVAGLSLSPPSLRPSNPIRSEAGPDSVFVSWSVTRSTQSGVLRAVRVTNDRDTLFVRELAYDPVGVPPSVADSLLESVRSSAAIYGARASDYVEAMTDGIQLPEFRPPVRRVLHGVDGAVWLELNQASQEVAEWIVLDPGGSVVGRVALPLQTRPAHIDSATIWAVELDELAVPWLVRIDLEYGPTS